MNNIIKKISAAAMAFAILGTGAAITSNVFPESNNTIVAEAAQLPPYMNYTAHTSPNPNRDYYFQSTYNHSTGDAVKWIQCALNYYYRTWRLDVDGDFGPATASLVLRFQSDFNKRNPQKNFGMAELKLDGVYGPNTHRAMMKMINGGYSGTL